MTWLPAIRPGASVPKGEYRERSQGLRRALLEAQAQFRRAPASLALVVTGVDGAGKGETVNLLNKWMDPRWIRTRAFDVGEARSTRNDELGSAPETRRDSRGRRYLTASGQPRHRNLLPDPHGRPESVAEW